MLAPRSALFSCILALSGCAAQGGIVTRYVASTGDAYTIVERHTSPSPAADRALRTSGAHDLGCTEENLTVNRMPRHEIVVDGCGQRAVYAENCHDVTPGVYGNAVCEYVLTSRFAR